jgi:hypothetical protein
VSQFPKIKRLKYGEGHLAFQNQNSRIEIFRELMKFFQSQSVSCCIRPCQLRQHQSFVNFWGLQDG